MNIILTVRNDSDFINKSISAVLEANMVFPLAGLFDVGVHIKLLCNASTIYVLYLNMNGIVYKKKNENNYMVPNLPPTLRWQKIETQPIRLAQGKKGVGKPLTKLRYDRATISHQGGRGQKEPTISRDASNEGQKLSLSLTGAVPFCTTYCTPSI